VQEARAELALLQNSATESPKNAIAKSADGDNDLTESGAKVISRDTIVGKKNESSVAVARNESPIVPSANQKPSGRIPQIRKITTKSARIPLE